MPVQPEYIDSFFIPNSRGGNDATNKTREAVFKFVVEKIINRETNPYSNHARYGPKWQQLIRAIDVLIRQIGQGRGTATEIFPRGGRGCNFDFELVFETPSGTIFRIPLELKKGASIYDQPQFLSLYANDELVSGTTYPEFFYDEYVSRVAEFNQFSPPDRQNYLRLIFGNVYSRHPFFQSIYEADGLSDASERRKKGARSNMVDQSRDRYLREHALSKLRLDVLQNRLNEQPPKWFASWSADDCSFTIERFSIADVTIVGGASLKNGRNGLAHTIVLKMESGNEVHALLRWKNHIGVLGPAWQISMLQP